MLLLLPFQASANTIKDTIDELYNIAASTPSATRRPNFTQPQAVVGKCHPTSSSSMPRRAPRAARRGASSAAEIATTVDDDNGINKSAGSFIAVHAMTIVDSGKR
jgi:hypothetical protein